MSDKNGNTFGNLMLNKKLLISGIILLITCACLLSWWALISIKENFESNTRESLETILVTTMEATEIWVEDHKSRLTDLAADPRIIENAKLQIESHKNGDDLLKTKSLEKLRSIFREMQSRTGHVGFFIIMEDGTSIASLRDSNIGTRNLMVDKFPDFLERSFRGESLFIPPIESDVAIKDQANVTNKKTPPTMFFTTPIIDNGEVIAIITERFIPEEDFSRVMFVGRMGETGETYAFNSEGSLLSESRFIDQLVDIGLVLQGNTSILSFEIKDPGVNLIKGQESKVLKKEQPLTLMASDATLGHTGFNIKGYRDYRGVEVVGAWTWNDILGIGLTTEIELNEAMHPYYLARRIILTTVLLIVSISIVGIIFNEIRESKIESILKKNNEMLEEMVEERTFELNSLYKSSLSLNNMLELNDVLDEILISMKGVMSYDTASVALKYGSKIKIVNCIGFEDPEEVIGLEFPVDLFRYVNESSDNYQPMVYNNIEDFEGFVDKTHGQIKSIMMLPLVYQNQLLGRLTFDSFYRDFFTERKVKTALAFTTHAALAVYNAKQYEEIRIAKIHAEDATKAKSMFLANMSHEIRTPMNAVLGHSQILMRDKELSKSQKNSIGSIHSSGTHLLNLINDILDMSKIESGKVVITKKSLDIKRLLLDVFNMFDLRMKNKGLEFKINTAVDLPEFIAGDAQRIRQVLINLIGNAYKFTKAGFISVSCRVESDMLTIEVKDSGCGISKEDLENIFYAFIQTGESLRSSGGTGLGLSISRETARLMGGDIIVKSEINKGSSFIFTFLFELAQKLQPENDNDIKRVLKLQENYIGTKILIVDDNGENRKVARLMLEPLGFQIEEAINGVEAIQRYKEWAPKIILMDIIMPIMNGIEAIKTIRTEYQDRNTKIIALSASAFDSEKTDVVNYGADLFLTKPFIESELLKGIRSLGKVEYIYDDSEEINKVDGTKMVILTDFNLDELEANMKKSLVDMALIGDTQELYRLADELSKTNTEVSQGLKIRIDDFDFESIISLFGRE